MGGNGAHCGGRKSAGIARHGEHMVVVCDRASSDQSIWSRWQSVRLGCAGQRVAELRGCSDGLCARGSGAGPVALWLSAAAVSLLELIREQLGEEGCDETC